MQLFFVSIGGNSNVVRAEAREQVIQILNDRTTVDGRRVYEPSAVRNCEIDEISVEGDAGVIA